MEPQGRLDTGNRIPGSRELTTQQSGQPASSMAALPIHAILKKKNDTKELLYDRDTGLRTIKQTHCYQKGKGWGERMKKLESDRAELERV